MEWIIVSDRLPESHKVSVLCYLDRRSMTDEKMEPEMHTGHLMHNSTKWVVGNVFEWDLGKVTHWTPLPPPPTPLTDDPTNK